MKRYKVWIEIEEEDDETGDSSNLDVLTFASTAVFDTLEEAVAFAEKLHFENGGVFP